jgi:hypothetical protein
MSIRFNPFGPVCNNILIPLAQSLYKPYDTLFQQSIKPLYRFVMNPSQDYYDAVERYTILIKTAELVVQFCVYLFCYQKGWEIGTHYLGLAGGALAFSLIYAAGCWVDTQLKTNTHDICTGTWLYLKGLRNLGVNREAMLASMIVAGHLTKKHGDPHAPTGWEKQRTKAAEWIAGCIFKKEPLLPLGNEDGSRDLIDRPQDSSNGQCEQTVAHFTPAASIHETGTTGQILSDG